MSDLRAGQTVELTIEAKVVCTYQDSNQVKLRWGGGETTVLPSDARLNAYE